MLVLTRKLMEKLYIGDEICVTVVRLEGGQVRLGIDAPRHIPVVRAELTESRKASRSSRAIGASSAHNPNPSDVRTQPVATHGIDIRRRAPFR
jgi:carbon storage regulator